MYNGTYEELLRAPLSHHPPYSLLKMVRTIIPPLNHHNQHDEQHDHTQAVANGGKIVLQNPNNFRSKHSETERRRRSKINQRFQLLRDIIPPIDQKRDKASLLLEVIDYIQFLQEKLQVYEQSYQQFWSQEPTKLIPWRANHGPVDNYANNSQTIKNVFLDENTAVQSMAAIQDSVKSEFEGEYAYSADHSAGLVNPVPLNIPLQPSSYPLGTGIQLVDNLSSHPRGSFIAEGAIMGIKERTFGKGSSSVSDIYSRGLRKKLIKALQSSGVYISQADISVQLEVGKQVNSGSTALVSTVEDAVNQPPNDQPMPDCTEVSAEDIQAAKRLRIDKI